MIKRLIPPESLNLHLCPALSVAILMVLLFFHAGYGFAVEKDQDCVSPAFLGSEAWPGLQAMFHDQGKLLADNKLDKAIEVQREIVRLQCHNHYQWYYLAELLLKAGETKQAVLWLDKLYDRKVNDLESRLYTEGNSLYPLSSHPDFVGSPLAQKIAARKILFAQRQKHFKQKLAALTARDKPPGNYIAEGVCPFECCSYRQWGVREAVTLVSEPLSHDALATVLVGDQVSGLTGKVYLSPTPVAVVHAIPAYDPARSVVAGDIVFLLDVMGEGFRHVWHQGAVTSMSTSGEVQRMCPFPDAQCWGELLGDESEHEWWVKVRLGDGTEGWTNNTHAFDNMDACG